MEFNDNSIMPFGKYKGKAMVNVPAVYLVCLYDQGCTHDDVRKYIATNLDVLKKEASQLTKFK